MVKSIWPELVIKTRTGEHGTKSIANSTMGSFDRTILMRGISSGSLDGVSSMLEKVHNSATMGQITAAIHTNIFVRYVTREPLDSEKTVQEINRGGFGHESFATKGAAKVVRNEDIARLTMEANIALEASGIDGFLNNKTKINRKPLPTLCSRTRIIKRTSVFVKLGGGTNRTSIEGSGVGEPRDTRGVLVKVSETTRM
jgi:hypothetical protein